LALSTVLAEFAPVPTRAWCSSRRTPRVLDVCVARKVVPARGTGVDVRAGAQENMSVSDASSTCAARERAAHDMHRACTHTREGHGRMHARINAGEAPSGTDSPALLLKSAET
jgi:hypothetical protein